MKGPRDRGFSDSGPLSSGPPRCSIRTLVGLMLCVFSSTLQGYVRECVYCRLRTFLRRGDSLPAENGRSLCGRRLVRFDGDRGATCCHQVRARAASPSMRYRPVLRHRAAKTTCRTHRRTRMNWRRGVERGCAQAQPYGQAKGTQLVYPVKNNVLCRIAVSCLNMPVVYPYRAGARSRPPPSVSVVKIPVNGQQLAVISARAVVVM